MKKIFLLFFLFAASSQAQVLWGINTDDLSVTNSWKTTKDFDGNPLKTRGNVYDFDYVTSNEKGFLFFRENPPDYMFDDVYKYLFQLLGAPDLNDDFTPESDVNNYLDTPTKVQIGKWKYYRTWKTENKYVTLSWKENKLMVDCEY